MISETKNLLKNASANSCGLLIGLQEYIKENFPKAKERKDCDSLTYETDGSYVSFSCQKKHFRLLSVDKNVLQVVKTLLPKAKLKKNSVKIKSTEMYALHAIKVAIHYAFNPNKVIYSNILEAVFLSRPNRFIANIEVNGEKKICHVKNTGRCRELLIPGCKIYVKKHNNPERKTDYSLISVVKGDRLINIDSQVPNKAIHKWLLQNNLFYDIEYIKPEYKYNKSRIDFFIKTKTRKILLEVKGVTLEEDGIALFPDAPTERGLNHVKELIKAKKEGYDSYIVFVVQMNSLKYFTPNEKTHPEFKEALIQARKNGVCILAYDCLVTSDSIAINNACPVVL